MTDWEDHRFEGKVSTDSQKLNRSRKLWLPIFLLGLGFYLLTTRGLALGDNQVHLDVALGMAERGSVSLSYNPGNFFSIRDNHGQFQSALWPGMALFAVPLVYAGSALEHTSASKQPQPLGPVFQALSSDESDLGKGPDVEPAGFRDNARIEQLRSLGIGKQIELLNEDWRVKAFALINPLACAATLAVFFLCCLGLGITTRISLWTTVGLGLGSHAFSFAGTCWTQPLAMFFVTAANYQFIRHQNSLHVKQTLACSAFMAVASGLCFRSDAFLSTWPAAGRVRHAV